MVTTKDLEMRVKEIRKIEKNINLVGELKTTIEKMSKLDGCSALNEILIFASGYFNDDLYRDVVRTLNKLSRQKDELLIK